MARVEDPSPSVYGPERLRRVRELRPDSRSIRLAGVLKHAGLAGVEELNGPDILRLGSSVTMFSEVLSALAHAEKVGQETGTTPSVYGEDLVRLGRLIRAGKYQRGDGIRNQIDAERARIYEKITHSAGALAVNGSNPAS